MMETLEARAPSLKERQRREREELILDEAERLLGERGYNHLVMEELAERVGIGKGTIYLHFPGKDDLVGAIIQRGLERMIRHLEAIAAERARAAADRLRTIIADLLAGKRQWTHFLAESARRELLASMSDQPDFREGQTRLIAILAGVIEEGKARGEFDRAIAAPVAAVSLFALFHLHGSDILAKGFGLNRAAMVDSVMRLYFQGLCARPDEKETTR